MQSKLMTLSDQIKILNEPLSFSEINLDENLETLENENWGPPTFPSYVVTTCYEMRTIPLKQLTTEHLRLAIGQKFSLPYLIPLALEKLQHNPLLSVSFFDGDLLKNLLSLPDEYYGWDKASTLSLLVLAKKAKAILRAKESTRKLYSSDIEIMTLIEKFTQKYSDV